MAKKAAAPMTIEEKLKAALVPATEQPYAVPENWCWIRLLDSFDNQTDSKKKIQQNEYLEQGSIAIVDQGQEMIGGYTDDTSMTFSGSLPVIIFGDHTRCIKYIDFPFVQGADGVKILVPKKFYMPKFFYYALQNLHIPNMGYRRHYPILKNYCISLIPLAEQRRIVERIEILFAKLDEAKEKAQAVIDGYEDRKAAILHRAFTGELTKHWRVIHGVPSDSWQTVTFDEAAEVKSNLVDPALYLDYPHIAPDNIEKKSGRLLHYRTISKDGVTSGKHLFHCGQILYSKIRPYLSKVVIVDFDGLCSADMYPVEPKKGIDTRYLWYFMLSDDFLEQASSAGSRSVLPKINQKELNRLKIKVTILDEQREIVRILDDLLAKEAAVKEAAETTLAIIDAMKQSILSRAFRGELGTNDPNDEPAEELLKRILA